MTTLTQSGSASLRRDVLERVTDGVVALDTALRYTYVNQPAETILDKRSDELLGNTVWEVFPETASTEARDHVETALRTQDEFSYERYNPQLERWFHVRIYPDEGGLTILFTDETERKRREQELRALNEEYEAIIENAADAVFLIDVESTDEDGEPQPDRCGFRYERLNPAYEATTGLRTTDVQGKTPCDLFEEDVAAALATNYQRCVDARAPITFVEGLPLPEGQFVWQTSLAPVVVDGDVTRIVGIARDITTQIDQEQTLRRQNERLDEFAVIISQYLRNPLTVALGRVRHVRSEYESEHLDATLRALTRMEAILDDTRTLARQGDTLSDRAAVPLAGVLAERWETVAPASATLDVADGVVVQADRYRLPYLFENLLKNAIEYGGSDVTVRVGQTGERGFYLEDDGPGVPLADRESVFKPTYSSRPDGSGLGLTIVKRIAEAHGWRVALTDGTAGGARFEFTGVEIVQ